MSYKYIAIEREYGSGGTKIARQLSEECGILEMQRFSAII